MAQDLAKMGLPGDIPVPLTKEDQMEAYLEAKRLMFLRNVILTITIASVLSCAFAAVLLAMVCLPALRLVP